MNKLKSYFMFSSEHRSGIFLLFIIIFLLQILLFSYDKYSSFFFSKSKIENKEWEKFQSVFDSINQNNSKEFKIQPFNPNFISDYKGYQLGMSVEEIDRLHNFRNTGKFVNSGKEFQNVTKISDSLLQKMEVYFKFPDWINQKQNQKFDSNKKESPVKIVKKNINEASKEDLMKIYGIGDKISDIILKEKDKFGSFTSLSQLQYVWGVSEEVYAELNKNFFVEFNKEQLKTIKINEVSIKELSKFPYFNYSLAKEIITHRSMSGDFKKIEDLTKINNFPVDKIEIIVLYLDFN